MRLYEIPAAMRFALDCMEVDEETGEILNSAELEQIEGAARDKIEASALYILELEAEAEAVKAEASRMLDRSKSLAKKAERIKALVQSALPALDGKVKTARVTVSIRTTQAVEVSEGANLPEAYTTVKTTVSPNKIAIKQALLDGVEVSGCHLEARESVSIR